MTATRRIGKESSKTRAMLLDAAERIMFEEGFAAVSSRRVAAAAELKPALVHYYFPTMDDLFVTLFRRGAERNMEGLTAAAASTQPLRALWTFINGQRGAVFLMEFAAASRHHAAVRAEIAAYGQRFRELQLRTIRRVLERHGIDESIVTAEAVAVLITSLSTTLTLEDELGVSTGHAEALALVEQLLQRYEPE